MSDSVNKKYIDITECRKKNGLGEQITFVPVGIMPPGRDEFYLNYGCPTGAWNELLRNYPKEIQDASVAERNAK